MFIATMYSYGSDANAVGVDGIRGCLGVFLATPGQLYAIHVPQTEAHYDAGRNAFVNYVLNAEGPLPDKSQWRLYAVINGTNRGGAYGELLQYASGLGIRRLKTVRVNEYLGPKGQMQDSAAIVLERGFGGTLRLKYKRAEHVNWNHGVGTARGGYYHNASFNYVLSADTAPMHGWITVDQSNSTIATTNW